MITRPILEAQKELYVKGKADALAKVNEAAASVNAFNGAIEAIDNLLNICAQKEEAQAAAETPAATEGETHA